jgi:hypothetical protein
LGIAGKPGSEDWFRIAAHPREKYAALQGPPAEVLNEQLENLNHSTALYREQMTTI